MKASPANHEGQSGFALAIVLVFLMVLTMTMFVASGLTWTDIRVVTNLTDEKRAVSVAEAGVGEAFKRLSLTAATNVTVDGNTFNAAFAPAAGNSGCSTSSDFCPDETNPNWNAQILFGTGTTTTSKSADTVTTRTAQINDSSRLLYSSASADTPDNGTLTMRWNCLSGASPCASVADIRKIFNLPVLDIISTGHFNAASRKVTTSVIPGVPGLGTYRDGCPPRGVDMVGTVQVTVNGTVQVNSTCNGGGNGYALDGNGGTLVSTGGQMNIVGGVAAGHASSPDLNTGAPRQDDPLGPTRANLQPPCFGSITTGCNSSNTLVVRNGSSTNPSTLPVNGGTLYPGIYYGGLDLSGTVTMNEGIYVMAGGGLYYHNGNTSVSSAGHGIMIFNTQNDNASCRSGGNPCNAGAIGQIRGHGNPTINITSPDSGYYQGIAIFQDRDIPIAQQPLLDLQGGNSNNSLIDGLIYAVNATLNFQGGINVAGNIIVGGMTANGSVNITGAAHNTPLIAERSGFTQIVAWKDI